MRSLLIERPISFVDLGKEIVRSIAIVVVVYLVSFGAILIMTVGGIEKVDAVGWVSGAVGVITAATFLTIRFPLWTVALIGIGVGLFVRGAYGFDPAPWMIECILGTFFVFRGFSVGPARQ